MVLTGGAWRMAIQRVKEQEGWQRNIRKTTLAVFLSRNMVPNTVSNRISHLPPPPKTLNFGVPELRAGKLHHLRINLPVSNYLAKYSACLPAW
eukprot:jgi/Mesvir1/17197/Mv26418-RA.1